LLRARSLFGSSRLRAYPHIHECASTLTFMNVHKLAHAVGGCAVNPGRVSNPHSRHREGGKCEEYCPSGPRIPSPPVTSVTDNRPPDWISQESFADTETVPPSSDRCETRFALTRCWVKQRVSRYLPTSSRESHVVHRLFDQPSNYGIRL
jgi:hypothetical protein